jgi:hypothetical protein
MNHGISHISIPTPCTQNWADMDIAEQGRYCQSCRKTVTDFSSLTNDQILKTLSASGDTCGRFAFGQLDILNSTLVPQKPSRFSWKKLSIAAAFIGLIPAIKTEAQTNPKVHAAPALKQQDTLEIRQAKPDLAHLDTELNKNIANIPPISSSCDWLTGLVGGISIQGVDIVADRTTRELILGLFGF